MVGTSTKVGQVLWMSGSLLELKVASFPDLLHLQF